MKDLIESVLHTMTAKLLISFAVLVVSFFVLGAVFVSIGLSENTTVIFSALLAFLIAIGVAGELAER